MSNNLGPRTHTSASPGRPVSGRASAKNTHAREDGEGATGQISKVNVTAATNAETYQIRFQGDDLDVTVLTGLTVSTSQAELTALVFAAIDDNSIVRGLAKSVLAGTNEVSVNWKDRTRPVLVTFPDNPNVDLTLTDTEATSAPRYKYGHAAENLGRAATTARHLIVESIRRPVQIAGAVLAQAITHAGGVTWTLKYLVDGALATVTVVAGGSAAATDTAAKAALDAALPAGTVVTINGTGDLSIALTPGVTFAVISEVSDGAGSIATTETTPAAALPKLTFIADDESTAEFLTAEAVQGPTTGPHPGQAILTADPNSGLDEWATFAPPAGETVTNGGAMFVEADSGSAYWGRLVTTPGQSRIPFAGPVWVGLDPSNPTLAHFRL